MVQYSIVKKGNQGNEWRLHKLTRPIHISVAHSRLTGSAVVRRAAVLMELAEQWPDTTTSCRAELSVHTVALAARAMVAILLFFECRCFVCDVSDGDCITVPHGVNIPLGYIIPW